MIGSTYISDPLKWASYYKNILQEGSNVYRHKNNQYGRGAPRRPHMRTLTAPTIGEETPEKIVVGKQVTQVEAVEDRVKSEHMEAIKEDKPHIPTGIKTVNALKSVSMTSNGKRSTSRIRRAKRFKGNKRKLRTIVKRKSKGRKSKSSKKKTVRKRSIFSRFNNRK